MLGASAEREKQRQFITGREDKRAERREKELSLTNKLGYLRGISSDKALTPESREAALQKQSDIISDPDTDFGDGIATKFMKQPTYKLMPETYGMFTNLKPEQEFSMGIKTKLDQMALRQRESRLSRESKQEESRLKRIDKGKDGKGDSSRDRNYLLMVKKDAMKLHEKAKPYRDPDTGEIKKEKGLPERLNYFNEPINKILAKEEKDWTTEDREFIEHLKPYNPEAEIPKDRPRGQKYYEQFLVK